MPSHVCFLKGYGLPSIRVTSFLKSIVLLIAKKARFDRVSVWAARPSLLVGGCFIEAGHVSSCLDLVVFLLLADARIPLAAAEHGMTTCMSFYVH